MDEQAKSVSAAIAALLDEKKAVDIKVIDMSGQASYTDILVIAGGTSSRHVSSLGDDVDRYAGENKVAVLGCEGRTIGDWVLIDLDFVVVHIFREEIRSFYNLEKLWSSAVGLRQASSQNSGEDYDEDSGEDSVDDSGEDSVDDSSDASGEDSGDASGDASGAASGGDASGDE